MQQKSSKHFVISVLLHVVVLLALILGYESKSKVLVLENSKENEIVNAMVVMAPKKPKKIIEKPKPKPIKKIAKAKPKPKPKPKPKVKKVAKASKPKAIATKPKKKVNKSEIEKKLLADLNKQKKIKQKKEKLSKLQADFAKEMKELEEKAISDRMLEEQKILEARAKQLRGVVDKYKALILESISQHWLVPHKANKKSYAKLLIRLAPGGTVLDVKLVKGSGDDSLDRSAQAAVFKASPLPVPADNESFEPFRQFVLKVKPESVLASDSWING